MGERAVFLFFMVHFSKEPAMDIKKLCELKIQWVSLNSYLCMSMRLVEKLSGYTVHITMVCGGARETSFSRDAYRIFIQNKATHSFFTK